MRRLVLAVSLAAVPLLAARGARAQTAQDVFTVSSVVIDADTGIVRVPVYLHDVPGTTFGRDQPPGRRITAVAFNVVYGPLACADTVEPYFDVATGVLSGTKGVVLASPGVPHRSQGFVFATADPAGLPIVSDAPPGDKLGDLLFSVDACAGAPIRLALDPLATGLAGTWMESGERPTPLTLVDGSLVFPGARIVASTPTPTPTPAGEPRASAPGPPVAHAIPALGGRALVLLALALAAAGALLARRAG